jgi:acyl-CoA thioesterase FadM
MGIVFNANWPLLYERVLKNRISGLENKFIAPAYLGDDIDITTESNDSESYKCEARVNGKLVNSAQVFPSRPIASLLSEGVAGVDFDELEVQVYSDELHRDDTLSSVSFLKYCERARTEKIGGPLSIQRGIEEGVAVVVAKISLDLTNERISDGSRLIVRSRVRHHLLDFRTDTKILTYRFARRR